MYIDTLKNASHFNAIFKNATKFNDVAISIYIADLNVFFSKIKKRDSNIFKSNTLLGFSINKKVGNAVKRNLIKRRIKSIALILKQQENITNNTNCNNHSDIYTANAQKWHNFNTKRNFNLIENKCIVFVCRKECVALSFDELKKIITKALIFAKNKSINTRHFESKS